MSRILFLDCDSTLSAIEGVDELAALRGPAAQAEVEDLTSAAMNGEIAIDEVFARRLDLIRPDRSMCREVAQLYIDRVAPGCVESLSRLRAAGWHPVIVSGGFQQVIEPLAAFLGISEIHAVPLLFDEIGEYAGFDAEAPTSRNGGKAEVARDVLLGHPEAYSVMVGDGVSDMECRGITDLVVGYGEFAERPAVVAQADRFVRSFGELETLLGSLP